MHILVITCRNIFNNDDRKVYTRFQIFSNKKWYFNRESFKSLDKSKQVNPVLAIVGSKYVISIVVTWSDLWEQRIDTNIDAKLNFQVRHLVCEKKLKEMKKYQEKEFWLVQKV